MSIVLLVRHGQASFGAEDYDQLSPTGFEQARVLGAAIAGIAPTRVVRGSLRRHRETTQAAVQAAGWTAEVGTDPGWDEFDHTQVLAVHAPPESEEDRSERQAFQRWFELATSHWVRAGDDDRYGESFAAFTTRVDAAMSRLISETGPGETAVVFTSGGAIASVAASILSADLDVGGDLWLRLNRVTVNSGITKLVVGRSGTSLVTFNDHAHLPRDLITYR